MTRCQILQTNIMRIVWQTVRRIANEILGVKGQLTIFPLYLSPFQVRTIHYLQFTGIKTKSPANIIEKPDTVNIL